MESDVTQEHNNIRQQATPGWNTRMASFALSPRVILEGAKNIHRNKFVPRISGYRMQSEGKIQELQCYRVKAEGDPITDFDPGLACNPSIGERMF